MASRLPTAQVLVGLVIVLVGVLLFLDTTGVADTGALFRYTPSVFVLVGLYAMATSGFRNLVGPLVLIIVAGSIQLVTLDLVEWADLAVLWPVAVILFGLSMLVGHFDRRTPTTDRSTVDTFSLFGDSDRRVVGDAFEEADVTVLFGGATLDLRDASAAAHPVRVNVLVLFGGVDVVVPRDWNVELDVMPVFGAAEDNRLRGGADHEAVDLVVTGSVLFGEVALKD